MRPRDVPRGAILSAALMTHDAATRPLPGLLPAGATDSFVEQLVESIRRIEYIQHIHRRPIHAVRANPASPLFDPLMAASLAQRAGNIEEGCWLVFLSVHFGKHRQVGWQLARDFYRALGTGPCWDWAYSSHNPSAIAPWFIANEAALKPRGHVCFGNHRKYQSIGSGPNGTAAVIRSYIDWVIRHTSHNNLFASALSAAVGDPHKAFASLNSSMVSVRGFGRTARFDYLTMIGKLDLAPITPGMPYLVGSTGPLQGARLLFNANGAPPTPTRILNEWVVELGLSLGVGMQVMEDALCNWQKSPHAFVPFRG